MYLGEVIHEYRKKHRLSMQTFADICDLSKGYIAMLEKNVNSKTGAPIVPSIETFIKVANAMNITLDQLMEKVDENHPEAIPVLKDNSMLSKTIKDLELTDLENMLKEIHLKDDEINTQHYIPTISTRIPVYGCIPAGIPLEAVNDVIGYVDIPDEWLKSGDTFFSLKVKGNSMSPKYIDGDLIILKRQPDCESGQDAAVRVNGDEATLKKVIKQEYGIILQPINPEYEPRMYYYGDQTPIEIMGIVVQLRRDV